MAVNFGGEILMAKHAVTQMPRGGAIVVSQRPLTDVIENIRNFETQRRAEPPEPWLSTKP